MESVECRVQGAEGEVFLYTLHSALCTKNTVRRSAKYMRISFKIITAITLFIATMSPIRVQADRLTVVASVFPLFDFAREVAGSDADVRMLLPAGVEPHSWEPKPSDIVAVSNADVFLYVSETMEPWAHNLVRAVKGKDTAFVEIMSRIRLPQDEERAGSSNIGVEKNSTENDPHFWLDLSLSAQAVEIIGRVLSQKDPENQDNFTARARAYAHRVQELDRVFVDSLQHCRTRRFVTGGHSDFGHLARRYGLIQIPLYGLSPDSEPTPAYLVSVVQTMRENNLQVVFFEEMVNPRLAKVLASETGASMEVLIPAGNITARRMEQGTTLIQIMKENLSSLREGLSCD